jgi:hypothetical protein
MPGGRVARGPWPNKFSRGSKHYDLTAQVGSEHTSRVPAGSFQAVRIEIEGWVSQGARPVSRHAVGGAGIAPAIRFEVKCRSTTNTGGAFFMIDETVAIAND